MNHSKDRPSGRMLITGGLCIIRYLIALIVIICLWAGYPALGHRFLFP